MNQNWPYIFLIFRRVAEFRTSGINFSKYETIKHNSSKTTRRKFCCEKLATRDDVKSFTADHE